MRNKIIDFKRNLVFQSLNVRNDKKYQAFNYTGMSIVKTELLRKFDKYFKNAENFEQEFYPRVIKKFRTELIKVKGFWHSIAIQISAFLFSNPEVLSTGVVF